MVSFHVHSCISNLKDQIFVIIRCMKESEFRVDICRQFIRFIIYRQTLQTEFQIHLSIILLYRPGTNKP
ncbi:hypothetical protein BpHYR1_035797 [Brachionus plicatilis]|uniref:Uncharacterized protein n=1 Tax=Brachionus plicatilis TaxID=10195 RepID=A0A3M7QUE6_BRAPC|nr:hypothetical protein BpHYR1_035797 [Brachionus plicatilis]